MSSPLAKPISDSRRSKIQRLVEFQRMRNALSTFNHGAESHDAMPVTTLTKGTKCDDDNNDIALTTARSRESLALTEISFNLTSTPLPTSDRSAMLRKGRHLMSDVSAVTVATGDVVFDCCKTVVAASPEGDVFRKPSTPSKSAKKLDFPIGSVSYNQTPLQQENDVSAVRDKRSLMSEGGMTINGDVSSDRMINVQENVGTQTHFDQEMFANKSGFDVRIGDNDGVITAVEAKHEDRNEALAENVECKNENTMPSSCTADFVVNKNISQQDVAQTVDETLNSTSRTFRIDPAVQKSTQVVGSVLTSTKPSGKHRVKSTTTAVQSGHCHSRTRHYDVDAVRAYMRAQRLQRRLSKSASGLPISGGLFPVGYHGDQQQQEPVQSGSTAPVTTRRAASSMRSMLINATQKNNRNAAEAYKRRMLSTSIQWGRPLLTTKAPSPISRRRLQSLTKIGPRAGREGSQLLSGPFRDVSGAPKRRSPPLRHNYAPLPKRISTQRNNVSTVPVHRIDRLCRHTRSSEDVSTPPVATQPSSLRGFKPAKRVSTSLDDVSTATRETSRKWIPPSKRTIETSNASIRATRSRSMPPKTSIVAVAKPENSEQLPVVKKPEENAAAGTRTSDNAVSRDTGRDLDMSTRHQTLENGTKEKDMEYVDKFLVELQHKLTDRITRISDANQINTDVIDATSQQSSTTVRDKDVVQITEQVATPSGGSIAKHVAFNDVTSPTGHVTSSPGHVILSSRDSVQPSNRTASLLQTDQKNDLMSFSPNQSTVSHRQIPPSISGSVEHSVLPNGNGGGDDDDISKTVNDDRTDLAVSSTLVTDSQSTSSMSTSLTPFAMHVHMTRLEFLNNARADLERIQHQRDLALAANAAPPITLPNTTAAMDALATGNDEIFRKFLSSAETAMNVVGDRLKKVASEALSPKSRAKSSTLDIGVQINFPVSRDIQTDDFSATPSKLRGHQTNEMFTSIEGLRLARDSSILDAQQLSKIEEPISSGIVTVSAVSVASKTTSMSSSDISNVSNRNKSSSHRNVNNSDSVETQIDNVVSSIKSVSDRAAETSNKTSDSVKSVSEVNNVSMDIGNVSVPTHSVSEHVSSLTRSVHSERESQRLAAAETSSPSSVPDAETHYSEDFEVLSQSGATVKTDDSKSEISTLRHHNHSISKRRDTSKSSAETSEEIRSVLSVAAPSDVKGVLRVVEQQSSDVLSTQRKLSLKEVADISVSNLRKKLSVSSRDDEDEVSKPIINRRDTRVSLETSMSGDTSRSATKQQSFSEKNGLQASGPESLSLVGTVNGADRKSDTSSSSQLVSDKSSSLALYTNGDTRVTLLMLRHLEQEETLRSQQQIERLRQQRRAIKRRAKYELVWLEKVKKAFISRGEADEWRERQRLVVVDLKRRLDKLDETLRNFATDGVTTKQHRHPKLSHERRRLDRRRMHSTHVDEFSVHDGTPFKEMQNQVGRSSVADSTSRRVLVTPTMGHRAAGSCDSADSNDDDKPHHTSGGLFKFQDTSFATRSARHLQRLQRSRPILPSPLNVTSDSASAEETDASETLSTSSSLVSRVLALRSDLERRQKEALELRRRQRRLRAEFLQHEERALQAQIQVYDEWIKKASEELANAEKATSETQINVTNTENRVTTPIVHKSGDDSSTLLSRHAAFSNLAESAAKKAQVNVSLFDHSEGSVAHQREPAQVLPSPVHFKDVGFTDAVDHTADDDIHSKGDFHIEEAENNSRDRSFPKGNLYAFDDDSKTDVVKSTLDTPEKLKPSVESGAQRSISDTKDDAGCKDSSLEAQLPVLVKEDVDDSIADNKIEEQAISEVRDDDNDKNNNVEEEDSIPEEISGTKHDSNVLAASRDVSEADLSLDASVTLPHTVTGAHDENVDVDGDGFGVKEAEVADVCDDATAAYIIDMHKSFYATRPETDLTGFLEAERAAALDDTDDDDDIDGDALLSEGNHHDDVQEKEEAKQIYDDHHHHSEVADDDVDNNNYSFSRRRKSDDDDVVNEQQQYDQEDDIFNSTASSSSHGIPSLEYESQAEEVEQRDDISERTLSPNDDDDNLQQASIDRKVDDHQFNDVFINGTEKLKDRIGCLDEVSGREDAPNKNVRSAVDRNQEEEIASSVSEAVEVLEEVFSLKSGSNSSPKLLVLNAAQAPSFQSVDQNIPTQSDDNDDVDKIRTAMDQSIGEHITHHERDDLLVEATAPLEEAPVIVEVSDQDDAYEDEVSHPLITEPAEIDEDFVQPADDTRRAASVIIEDVTDVDSTAAEKQPPEVVAVDDDDNVVEELTNYPGNDNVKPVEAKPAPEMETKSAPEVETQSASEIETKSAPEVEMKSAPEVEMKSAPEMEAEVLDVPDNKAEVGEERDVLGAVSGAVSEVEEDADDMWDRLMRETTAIKETSLNAVRARTPETKEWWLLNPGDNTGDKLSDISVETIEGIEDDFPTMDFTLTDEGGEQPPTKRLLVDENGGGVIVEDVPKKPPPAYDSSRAPPPQITPLQSATPQVEPQPLQPVALDVPHMSAIVTTCALTIYRALAAGNQLSTLEYTEVEEEEYSNAAQLSQNLLMFDLAKAACEDLFELVDSKVKMGETSHQSKGSLLRFSAKRVFAAEKISESDFAAAISDRVKRWYFQKSQYPRTKYMGNKHQDFVELVLEREIRQEEYSWLDYSEERAILLERAVDVAFESCADNVIADIFEIPNLDSFTEHPDNSAVDDNVVVPDGDNDNTAADPNGSASKNEISYT